MGGLDTDGGLLHRSSVDDLYTEGLLVEFLLVVDVDEDLFLAGALAWGETQANRIRLTSVHLHQQHHTIIHFSATTFLLLLHQ